jgi:ABC-type antimicrobial peptide transport system permease subunit
MVGIGLYGVYFGVTSVWQAALAQDGRDADLNLLDGFVLFTPGALVAAVASVVAVFMVSRSRNAELALLRTATATSTDIVLMLVLEAIIYTVTAALLALVIVILPITLMTSIGLALQGLPFEWHVDLRIPGGLALVGFVGTLVALLATAIPSLRRPVRSSLSRV